MRAVILIAVLAACGGGTPAQPDAPLTIDAPVGVDAPTPRETVTGVQSLDIGEVVESMMMGGGATSGDRAIIHLMAPSANLDWNIHAHPNGGTVTVHEELKQMTVTFDFIPAENTTWFLLLRNSGGVPMDVQVAVDLYGAMTFQF
jgi:hypothetical protein